MLGTYSKSLLELQIICGDERPSITAYRISTILYGLIKEISEDPNIKLGYIPTSLIADSIEAKNIYNPIAVPDNALVGEIICDIGIIAKVVRSRNGGSIIGILAEYRLSTMDVFQNLIGSRAALGKPLIAPTFYWYGKFYPIDLVKK